MYNVEITKNRFVFLEKKNIKYTCAFFCDIKLEFLFIWLVEKIKLKFFCKIIIKVTRWFWVKFNNAFNYVIKKPVNV